MGEGGMLRWRSLGALLKIKRGWLLVEYRLPLILLRFPSICSILALPSLPIPWLKG